MRACSWVTLLVIALVSYAAVASARDDGPVHVGVLWFPDSLGADCPVDDAAVAGEVRRIFGRMGVEIDWTTARGVSEYHGEVLLVGLVSSPRGRPFVMGSTNHGSRSAWVFCATIKEALGLGDLRGRPSAILSRALGRVAAHEITHVLAPAFGHSESGLMRATWREATLRDDLLGADAATRRAVRAQQATAVLDAATGAAADLIRAER